MNIIFENDIGYTSYDADEKIIYYRHAGIVKNELIIEHLKFAEKYGKKHLILAAIADITQLRGSFRRTFEFFKKEYYPTMGKQGQVCSAIVVSEDLITHFLSKEMGSLSSDIIVRNFFNMEEAKKWVKDVINKYKSSRSF